MKPPYSTVALAALIALGGAAADARAQQKVEPTRGELLYTTHCVECHNARVHWREQRLAKDWDSLRAQVRRWESYRKLGWSEPDISEVARYLNRYYYELPEPPRP